MMGSFRVMYGAMSILLALFVKLLIDMLGPSKPAEGKKAKKTAESKQVGSAGVRQPPSATISPTPAARILFGEDIGAGHLLCRNPMDFGSSIKLKERMPQ
mmetsp:Transcript_28501/g.59583  ORF Transcript_28501/g.59583 Transcript_28501/m.59583 type:complete len:100 (-) Transcript_28501:189-488(-)